jgi:hypothetical protein
MARKAKPQAGKSVEALRHRREEATRKNIPTAEYQSVVQKEAEQPLRVAYERRNRDLDPQLVWRGKDQQDWSDLVVQAPPLYIQEKVHPKALVDDLLRQSRARRQEAGQEIPDLFAEFNGIPEGVDRTEFYQHDQNWSNRMILGDSIQVMASLAEREGLRGKVQCIYIDPRTGSNSTATSSGVRRVAWLRMAKQIRSPASQSRSRPFVIRGAMAFTAILRIYVTDSLSPAICCVLPGLFSFRSATRMCTVSVRSWMRSLARRTALRRFS